ncbi:unnamed protein product [Moneuplotes crassus]|uniref:HIT-type domain-containing protein n=1 Tax=Euplotes crassus TaxID=5936 RepID=A0AAD1XAH1_EUPCR|nr:unnamed protein product [Moneuplotes crassus]
MIRQILQEVEDKRLEQELQDIKQQQEQEKQTLIEKHRKLYGSKEFGDAPINNKNSAIPGLGYDSTSTAPKSSSKMPKCAVCSKKNGEYICPKCKIQYCSIDCYKAHSETCTEDFYKSCVESELKKQRVNKHHTKDINEILRRHKEEAEQESSSLAPKFSKFKNEEILQKLEDLTLDDFTPQERQEFDLYVKSLRKNGAEINLKEWIPWWKHYEEVSETGEITGSSSALVEEIHPNSEIENKALLAINMNKFVLYDDLEKVEPETDGEKQTEDIEDPDPEENPIAHAFKTVLDELDSTEQDEVDDSDVITIEIDKNSSDEKTEEEIVNFTFSYKDKARLLKKKYDNIKPLKSITKKEPSSLIKYHIVNILYSFMFYYRFQNGEILSNPPTVDFDNARDLKDPTSLNNIKAAVNLSIEKLAKIEGYDLVTDYKPLVLQDMAEMFGKGDTSPKLNVIEGIFRLYDLIHSVEIDLKNPKKLFYKDTKKTKKLIVQEVSKITKLKHKLIFYLCYLKERDDAFFDQTAKEIKVLMQLE